MKAELSVDAIAGQFYQLLVSGLVRKVVYNLPRQMALPKSGCLVVIVSWIVNCFVIVIFWRKRRDEYRIYTA